VDRLRHTANLGTYRLKALSFLASAKELQKDSDHLYKPVSANLLILKECRFSLKNLVVREFLKIFPGNI
jgi:hypothetical protein